MGLFVRMLAISSNNQTQCKQQRVYLLTNKMEPVKTLIEDSGFLPPIVNPFENVRTTIPIYIFMCIMIIKLIF